LAAGTVITAVGAGIFALGAVIGGAATVIGFLGAVFAALVSPIGLTIGAIVAATAAWARYTASGRAAVSYLIERLGAFLAFGREVFGGIVDALLAGDIALAGRVAMAGLMVAVATGKAGIVRSWEDLKLRFFGLWDELSIKAQGAVAFIGGAFRSFAEQLGIDLPNLTALLTGVWTVFEIGAIAAFKTAMNAAMGFLSMMKLVTAGITAAFSEAQKLAPGAVSTAVAGVNAGGKATTGIDFAKIIADAEQARAETEAQLRGELSGRVMERESGRAAAIDSAAGAVAKARAELDEALAKAAAARKAAEERKADGPVPEGADIPDVVDIKRQALVTFSAAALVAGGGASPMQRVVDELRAIRERADKEIELGKKLLDKPVPGLRE
jgi:hypothetical protein